MRVMWLADFAYQILASCIFQNDKTPRDFAIAAKTIAIPHFLGMGYAHLPNVWQHVRYNRTALAVVPDSDTSRASIKRQQHIIEELIMRRLELQLQPPKIAFLDNSIFFSSPALWLLRRSLLILTTIWNTRMVTLNDERP